MKSLFLILSFVSGLAFAEERIGPDELLATFVANLTIDDSNVPFYGNAFLVHKNETHLFYVTNFHVIPQDKRLQSQLKLEGPLTGYKRFPVTVVGLDPGMEVALISIRQAGAVMAQPGFKNDFKVELPEDASKVSLQTDFDYARPYRLAIMGVNGGPNELGMEWSDLSWNAEMKQLSSWHSLTKTLNATDLSLNAEVDLSTEKIWIEETVDCPIVFLRRCYRLPLRSQGFSGSVLMLSNKDRPNFAIDPIFVAGLVSHYSVYTGDTYILPIEQVRRSATRLLQKAREIQFKSTVWNLKDETGTFEWISPTQIAVVGDIDAEEKLPRGTILSSANPRVGGGGPSTGGGGPSTGGGGPSTGGGGPSTGGGGVLAPNGWVLPDEIMQATGLFDLPRLLAEIPHPEKWGADSSQLTHLLSASTTLRGTRAFLNYVPGVRIGDEKALIGEWGGSQTWTLQNFVHAYLGATEKDFVPLKAPASGVLSAEMGLLKDSGFGAIYPISIHEFTTYPEDIVLPFAKTKVFGRQQVTKAEQRLWDLREAAKKKGNPFGNIVGARSTFPPQIPVQAASFKRLNGNVQIQLSTSLWGRIQIQFPDQWTPQVGDRNEYRGPLEVKEIFPLHPFPDAKFYGVVSIQRDFTRKELELRLFLLTKIDTRPRLPASAIQFDLWMEGINSGPWALALGIFVPLTADTKVNVPAGPSIEELEKEIHDSQVSFFQLLANPEIKKVQAEFEKLRRP